jgi:hypothetical protein
VLVAAGGVAHADPAPPAAGDDPRQLFGLTKPSAAAEPPLDCSDGRAFGCAVPTSSLADDVPYALSTWLPGGYLLSLPVGDATHDQVAGYALGAGRNDGGPSFGGATGLENRWTIDGAPADDPITGGNSTSIPLAFLDGMLVKAGGFAARDRTSTGGTIDAQLRRGTTDHELEAFVWATDALASQPRPLADDEFFIRRVSHGATPSLSAAIVATGPLGHVLGGTAWYVAGVAPSLSHDTFTWRTIRDVAGEPEDLPSPTAGVVSYAIPAMARLGLDAGVQHVELTAIGTADRNTSFLGNSTVQAAGKTLDDYAADGIATYHADWTDTRVRIQASWHRSAHRESARDPAAADQPQQLSAYVPASIAEDPQLAAECADPAQCPVPEGWFASGGAGPINNSTSDRPTVTADVAHRIANHTLRAGVTDEDSRVVTTSTFTGGEQLRSLFVGHESVEHYLPPTNNDPCPLDVTIPCATVATSTLTYRTRYAAGYLEDTWQPLPGMLIDGGVRDEYMQVADKIKFATQLSPRFGATYDFLGGGRSRAWLSAGRSAVMIPAGIGELLIRSNGDVEDITSTLGNGREFTLGTPYTVGGKLAAPYQDELTAGVEVAALRAVRVTAWVQGRWLRRGFDTLTDSFDNPGRDGLPEATRQSEQAALQLETSPTSALALRTGLLYGRVTGSWTGAYDPRQGAVLYGGGDYDTDATNQLGRLPQHPGTRLFVEAQRRGTLGAVQLAVALRLTAGSGAPRDVLADNGEGVIFLLPRGSAGDAPMETSANLRLALRWRGTDVTLDLFNVFDRTPAAQVNEIYTDDGVQPIAGGSATDLVFLKNAAGQPAVRALGYALPTAYQTPFAATLGVHHAF